MKKKQISKLVKKKKRQIFFKLTHAKPMNDYPDKSKIKWRKRNWRLQKGKTICVPKTHRPPKEKYYAVLENARVDLKHCELCGSDCKIVVHHKDGNPWNQRRQNLQVLCQNCHAKLHGIFEEGIHHEWEGTKADMDPLNDSEVRRFLGIIDEDEGVIIERR